MKRILIFGLVVFAIVVIIVAIAAVPGIRWLMHQRLVYIEKTTGIVFPSTTSKIDVFDNTEFFFAAHAKLQETDIESFSSKHRFTTTPVDVTPWIDVLKSENRTIPDNADLRYLEGRNNTNRWLMALDQNSGRMWIVVFYPDPGGTSP